MTSFVSKSKRQNENARNSRRRKSEQNEKQKAKFEDSKRLNERLKASVLRKEKVKQLLLEVIQNIGSLTPEAVGKCLVVCDKLNKEADAEECDWMSISLDPRTVSILRNVSNDVFISLNHDLANIRMK
jgi:hypothetical protein